MHLSPSATSPHSRVRLLILGALACAALLLVCGREVWSFVSHNQDDTAAVHALNASGDVLHQQWTMPGAALKADGLHVSYVNEQIVEQDGTGGQMNPPVNLAGIHLEAKGDFGIGASMSNVPGASLQLYGQVPIITDEFRVERASIRLTVEANNTLTAAIWDGSPATDLADPVPTQTQTFSFPAAKIASIDTRRQNGSLAFTINGQNVGSMSEHGIFSSGQVWFGANADRSGGDWVLSRLQARGLNARGSVLAVDGSAVQVPADPNGLQTLAEKKRPGFLVGTAIAPGPLYSDPNYQKTFFQNFGMFTPENALKRQFIEPQPGKFEFQQMDAMVALAAKQGITHIDGHALVFGEANPAYVTNAPTATDAERQAVQADTLNYISTVVGHYKGKITSWDVINEPFADYDQFDPANGDVYRDTVYYRAFGPSFIPKALQAAHEADPAAQLFINEFGLEEDGPRWDAMLKLVKQLKADNVPLTGIGFQAHEYDSGDQIDTAVLKKHFQQLAQLGLKARISEMDVYNDDGQGVQAQQYGNVLAACIAESNCISFTTWGFDDAYDVWQDDQNQLQYGQDLLWDVNDQPTPAVPALQKILKN